ncbi:hypothetical protein UFOVP23_23 [uncultured Caudovirales phage]|uniref:Uncharacterized protein n=1 Tax=uncultured Caudovirales phage TaxID=2100421 RepID=A0A6J5T7L5_9CAUD|nr:hypothetical protein UFOVP23_23 [uncultured Caudovirales phage]
MVTNDIHDVAATGDYGDEMYSSPVWQWSPAQAEAIIKKLIYFNLQHMRDESKDMDFYQIKYQEPIVCGIPRQDVEDGKVTYGTVIDNMFERIVALEVKDEGEVDDVPECEAVTK